MEVRGNKSIILLVVSVLLIMCSSFKGKMITEASDGFVTTGLTASAVGKNKVALNWSAVSGAEGYLVYAKKNNVYGYLGMTTTSTTYTDNNALYDDYNYYWVFPYYKDSTGKMIAGTCQTYKYAKGVCAAVTNLKASSVAGGVKLTWSKSTDAEYYIIYGIRANGTYEYIGVTTGATTYTDTKASTGMYNYYWVFPSFLDSSKKHVIGLTSSYVYGRALESDGTLHECAYAWSYLSDTTRILKCSGCGGTQGEIETSYISGGRQIWGYYDESGADLMQTAINETRLQSASSVYGKGWALEPSLTAIAQQRALQLVDDYSYNGKVTSDELIAYALGDPAEMYYAWCSSYTAVQTMTDFSFQRIGVAEFWYDSDNKGTMEPFWSVVFD